MGTKVSIKHSLSSSDFDLDKLKTELLTHAISFDMIASLDDQGEFEDFTNEFEKALVWLHVEASMYHDPGRMYMSNGDPGYPEESGCEDITVEKVPFQGKQLDVNDCLTDSALEEIEVALWEQFSDRSDDYDDRDDE